MSRPRRYEIINGAGGKDKVMKNAKLAMQNEKSIRLPEYQIKRVSYQKVRLNLKSDF